MGYTREQGKSSKEVPADFTDYTDLIAQKGPKDQLLGR